MSSDSRRYEWLFQSTCAVLSDAAEERRAHHHERSVFWRDEMAKADRLLRDEGIEYRRVPLTGGQESIRVMIDPERQQALDEARQKLDQHEAQEKRYEAWLRALSNELPGRSLELTIADREFFGL